MAFDRQRPRAGASARVGAIEHGEVLGLQARRAFQRHRPADMNVGGVDFVPGEAERAQHVEIEIVGFLGIEAEHTGAELFADLPLVEDEADVVGGGERGLDRLDLLVGEAARTQALVIDARRTGQRAAADRVIDNGGNRRIVIAERAQGLRHGAVDDLEIAAAGELLEFDQREIGLNAGRVAIHDEADRAGRRDDGRLCVAIAVALAHRNGEVPSGARMIDEVGLRTVGRVERHRRHVEAFIAGCQPMRGAGVIAHHAQHVLGVVRIARKRPELLGHLRRGRIGNAGHHRADRARKRARLVGIVSDAAGHQQPTDIGEAETERAEAERAFGDLAARELRHQHRDFEHDGPELDRMFEGLDIEAAIALAELHQVERGEVAGRVVEEHVFRARIAGADVAARRASVPVVDRGVELDAGIGARPGGVADLLPQLARRQHLRGRAVEAARQRPFGVVLDRAQEVVGHAHRVVGVLARNGEIGFGVPVGVVNPEVDFVVALFRELDHALHIVFRHMRATRRDDLALQRHVLLRIEAILAVALAIDAGAHDGVQMLAVDLRAGDERRHLLLFGHLPVDELLDVGMVDIDDHHFGGAPRRAAGFDRAGRPVADLQEAHQAGRLAAARELFVLAAQVREVGAGARAVFEEPRLAHPEIHDAVLVDEIVGDALDEAGMGLRKFIGALRPRRLGVGAPVALRRAVDAIGPVQPGVEPLRGIGRRDLRRQHEAQLVVKGARIFLAVEIAAFPAPIGPGAGQPVEHLASVHLGPEAVLGAQRRQRLVVGHMPPQEFGNALLGQPLQHGGDARFTEIFLRQHVAGDLAPFGGDRNILQPEDHRAVGISDFAGRRAEGDALVGRLALDCEATLDTHLTLGFSTLPICPADMTSRCAAPSGSSTLSG